MTLHPCFFRPARFLGLVLAALCAAPAQAATTIYPGAMCVADGQIERRENGEIWNKNTNIATYTMFNCPVVLTEGFGNYLGTVSATVFVRWNDNTLTPARFECALRTTSSQGEIVDFDSIIPLSKATGGTFTSASGSVVVPAAVAIPSSVHLRCRVPNGSNPINGGVNGTAGWGWAGIVSYRITH